MEQNPFYKSPSKLSDSPEKPCRYKRESNEEKLKILKVAEDIGIRKAAKFFRVSRANIQRWLKQKEDIKQFDNS